jgi:dTDP-3-amino-3,4,6-trideoxy-alpha-D-glucose transaminase
MIQMNDFQRQWADTRDDAVAAFEAVGESGWYILGRETREFEAALAEYWGRGHAVGVASGLDAIEISLRTLGCRPGDRVLTGPVSAFATALAILRIGAIPLFVDCDVYGMADLEQCREALDGDRDIRYFVPVHLYGNSLDLQALQEIAQEFDCAIVEDCAQSIGASHRGRPTGTAGAMAATSFYPTKNLGALGDGGAILCDGETLAEEARTWRDYGQSAKYRHERIGYNSRLDELHAAVLRRAHLPRLERWTAARRRIAAIYLAEIRNPAIATLGAPEGSNSCWHLFAVTVAPERKADFMEWLHRHEIGCAEHYPIALPDQPVMASVEFRVSGPLDRARRLCRSEVSLPIHPYLTEAEVERVAAVCNAWRG